ncbi:hypothetical protein QTQ03_29380 [Micromonospora sp. WMMA1363]|uniref:hypothetical protein n=1 Tax=Micromonospora sp. WMMA1363 TaxID=3053985 RepID=UPI00259CE7F9|nr:hypothetical protein [Micromonospora sp. WMMA1363]MDM4723492.1 hypothetical protein [Micromonospora sp. WMMA1363]
MSHFLLPLLVPAVGLALFAVTAIFVGRRLDGPDRPIVVVDRRTYRLAQRRIEVALDDKDLARAHAGLVALRLWLRGEIQTGPRRRRAEYAAALEQWELRADQAGFPGIVRG